MVTASDLDGDEALDATLVGGETSMVATKAATARKKPAVKSVAIRMTYLRFEGHRQLTATNDQPRLRVDQHSQLTASPKKGS